MNSDPKLSFVLYVQVQSSRKEIQDLQQQLRSSEALVADLQKTVQQRDFKVETLSPMVLTLLVH